MGETNQEQKPGLVHESVVEEHHAAPTRVVAIAGTFHPFIRAVDASEFSKHAFNWAVENLIKTETDQVVLLNVRPFVTAPMVYSAPILDVGAEYAKVDEANKKHSHDLIRSYAKGLMDKGVKVKGVALRGDPREEIVYKVEDLKADVLVIGSRGMGAMKRVFIGSTSDYCIHHCHCTVIVPRK